MLNSHGRFLLSYMAPIASNVTVIGILIWSGRHLKDERLVIPVAWAIVLGSALQFLVQLPSVLKFLPAFRPAFDTASEHVRSVFRNFGPIFLSRGVVQISSYIDSMIASLLPVSAVAALGYGQVISILPISLFSMSVSAAELPTLSSATGTTEEIAAFLRSRLSVGLRRIAFLIVPSAAAFLLLGDILVAALYQTQTGRFRHADAVYVWAVLAGSAVGLLATALGRLYSSAFYALLDTRTPLRFAMIRVALTVALGFPFALFLPGWIGYRSEMGRGRIDCFGRHRGMGRICFASQWARKTHRQDLTAGVVYGAAVGGGFIGRRFSLSGQASSWNRPSDSAGLVDAPALRCDLFRRHRRAWHRRVPLYTQVGC